MRIYLDLCCLNRPFDDQTQPVIGLETEAVIQVLRWVREGSLSLVIGEALELENRRNPDRRRRNAVLRLLRDAETYVPVGPAEGQRARELCAAGLRSFDALHVACAESGQAKVLLTTDHGLLRFARRNAARLRLKVMNPLQWIQEAVP